ncbi:MAG: SAM-dependent methyltransferase, partial [Desulfobacterales bacterium]|nr:SAM-dependent methyltransferase [Desulfobacterales bacterium]
VERGVFATRAPVRPNHIGLSIVRLLEVKGNTLVIEGVDVLDGTPLLDIKPYVAKFDQVTLSRDGWVKAGEEEIAEKRSDSRFQ